MISAINRQLKWREVGSALLLMIFVGVVSSFMISAAENIERAYEKYSPREWWFDYKSVVPHKDSFHVDEHPSFQSDAEFYKSGNVTWGDYLECFEEGVWVQYDPDVVTRYIEAPRKSNPGSIWELDSQPFKDTTEKCHAVIEVDFKTPHGYSKVQRFNTEDFTVTHERK